MPSIDRNNREPYYQQVYNQIAKGIESGLYPAGKKLPSIRECARELGVSNTTIEMAYQRLTAEGYVTARRGSGYTICALNTAPKGVLANYSEDYKAAHEALENEVIQSSLQPNPVFDFAYDCVDASTFPFAAWARICREVFISEGAEAACQYSDRQGLRELREQIAHFVGGEYGVNCTSEQILVMPTTRDLIAEIMALFDRNRTTIVMENPGYREVSDLLHNSGFKVRYLATHPYPSWDDAKGLLKDVKLAFATPACQFPTNMSMPLETRTALVEWAAQVGAYVIDDEYGCEFQSGISRMSPLGALDRHGRVITLGTFSSSFTPAVCLSYAVLPPELMMLWREKRMDARPKTPWQTQAAMSTFMQNDLWRSHVRKIRTSIQAKRKALINALNSYSKNSLKIVKGENSLFVLVNTRDGRSEEQLVSAAAESGIRVYPTSCYWHGQIPESWNYVLLGYAGIPLEDIEQAASMLVKAWGR